MKKDLRRREFLSGCFKAGAACMFLSGSGKLIPMESLQEKPDPKKLEYCGYKCPADCPLKKGTLENNTELKKKAYEAFKLREKYGLDFDAEKVFCYGCKARDKAPGPTVKGCSVRQCVISKGLDCCFECDNLSKCDKELWKEFPKHKEHVLGLQKLYRA